MNGPTNYRNGPKWTEMDRNGPKWTGITEMDIEMANFFPGLSLGDILPFPGCVGFWPLSTIVFPPRFSAVCGFK